MSKKRLFVVALLALMAVPLSVSAAGVYKSSNIGYDVSYVTKSYPIERFSFVIVSVTRGKAYTKNERLSSEYAWAKSFSSGGAPTIYMNLNAPYGSAVAGHISTPKPCPAATSTPSVATTTPSGKVVAPEPTACQGYNYGYNAAQDALANAKSAGFDSPLWWLDIEEANSWSPNTAVNDATIQGAIDYLNTKNIRVGVYSMTYMWNAIAGKGFVPKQTINGVAVSVPTWLPIGINNLVGAINTCNNRTSFMPGSPIWLVQYVKSSTAIDQIFSC